MTANGRGLQLPPLIKGLSARVLVLTAFFVMLSEVLIYAPSAGRFREDYLKDRLATAHVAVLSLLATPNNMVSDELQMELLHHAGAYVIALRRANGMKLVMRARRGVPMVDASFNLGRHEFFPLIGDAFAALVRDDDRILRVMGPSPKNPREEVEVVIDEAPMRTALIDYSERVLGLSILISLITASLVYLSLQWLMIRPMRRLTEAMVAFRDDPEDASATVRTSRRSDEIGVAERELARMQDGLRAALQQKARLAALGGAVTKINHDLRNILSTARLVSDRMAASGDPDVRRNARALLAAIDRAVELCSATLNFTRQGRATLACSRFALAELVEEVALALPANPGPADPDGSEGASEAEPMLRNAVPAELQVEADRSQLFRILSNLAQNAAQAGATRIAVSAERQADDVAIEVADNGPGLPLQARAHLFQPFAGSTRPEGFGLGLAIAQELARAHGGNVRLLRSTAEGTAFAIELPQRAVAQSRRPP